VYDIAAGPTVGLDVGTTLVLTKSSSAGVTEADALQVVTPSQVAVKLGDESAPFTLRLKANISPVAPGSV